MSWFNKPYVRIVSRFAKRRGTQLGQLAKKQAASLGNQFSRTRSPAPQNLKPPKNFLGSAVLGISVILFSIVGVGIWGSMAQLSSAVVAQGTFIASSKNKIIQHLEGGIIHEVLVKEGQIVSAGQTLIRLNKTSAEAQLRRLYLRRFMRMAMRSRLQSERSIGAKLVFPEILLAAKHDAEVKEMIKGQLAVYLARSREMESQIAVFIRRKNAIKEEIIGLEAQKKATRSELEFIEKELAATASLYKKGLTSLGKLLSLKRAKAKLEGTAGALTAQVGRAKERIEELDSEAYHLRSKRIEEAVTQLHKVENELSEIEEQIKASRDIYERLEVRAPVKGVVVKLAQNTAGGVVSSGQEILELLPLDDELIIEAYVRPQDIDIVRTGQQSWIRLSALDQRVTPVVQGKVVYVSADRLQGKTPGEVFYVARVQIDREEIDALGKIRPSPGMPAEVFIKTGERTLVQYLLRPFENSLARAMREQ